MDHYIVVPYTTGGHSTSYDIQTDKGRRLGAKLDLQAAELVCIELNEVYEGKAHG